MNILDTFSDLFKTGYNIYQDQRDFNYQKQLQQELFARDDNALQRRMADAEKAGINPLYAISSGAAGVSSGGTVSSKPLYIDTNFFANQQLKKAEKEAMDQEKKKREIEMKQMEIQLRAGKIANWNAMQDLNTKRLEHQILSNQLKNMETNNFYPFSNIGKIVSDISSLGNNILPFSIVNPFPNNGILGFIEKMVSKTSPETINKIKQTAQDVADGLGKKVKDIIPESNKDKIQKFADWLSQPVVKKKPNYITEYEARVLRGNSDKTRIPYATYAPKKTKTKKHRFYTETVTIPNKF